MAGEPRENSAEHGRSEQRRSIGGMQGVYQRAPILPNPCARRNGRIPSGKGPMHHSGIAAASAFDLPKGANGSGEGAARRVCFHLAIGLALLARNLLIGRGQGGYRANTGCPVQQAAMGKAKWAGSCGPHLRSTIRLKLHRMLLERHDDAARCIVRADARRSRRERQANGVDRRPHTDRLHGSSPLPRTRGHDWLGSGPILLPLRSECPRRTALPRIPRRARERKRAAVLREDRGRAAFRSAARPRWGRKASDEHLPHARGRKPISACAPVVSARSVVVFAWELAIVERRRWTREFTCR